MSLLKTAIEVNVHINPLQATHGSLTAGYHVCETTSTRRKINMDTEMLPFILDMESLRLKDPPTTPYEGAVMSRKCLDQYIHPYTGVGSLLSDVARGDELLYLDDCRLAGIERCLIRRAIEQLDFVPELTLVVRRRHTGMDSETMDEIILIKVIVETPNEGEDFVDGRSRTIITLKNFKCDPLIKCNICVPNNRGYVSCDEHGKLTISNEDKFALFEFKKCHDPNETEYAVFFTANIYSRRYLTVKNGCLETACRDKEEDSDIFICEEVSENTFVFESFTKKGFYIVHGKKLQLCKLSDYKYNETAQFTIYPS